MGEYLAVLAVDGWSCLRVDNGSYDPPLRFSLCFVLTVVGQNPRFLSYVSQTHVFRKAPERLETQLLHFLSRF